MPRTYTCPNCNAQFTDEHPMDFCALGVLFSVLRDRENLDPETLNERLESADIDVLWERLGPLLDDLEAGNLTA